jgi:hypothetical protein
MFVMGLSENQTINEQVVEEFNTYHDILQIEILDSYYVATIKIFNTFKWITDYCSNTKYILKVNDDVLVNTPNLINEFKNVIPYKQNHMFGQYLGPAGPDRNPASKWYVPESEYVGGYPRWPQGISPFFSKFFFT